MTFTSLSMRFLIALTLILTSCSEVNGSDEEVTGAGSQTVEFSDDELSSEGGAGIIYYSGRMATKWSASITAGADFASFSSFDKVVAKEGIVSSTDKSILYFYYTDNRSTVEQTTQDRQIEITFTFEGSKPIVLSINQLSSASEDSPYNQKGAPRWSEIPTMVDDDDYLYVTHYTDLANGTEVRNFSLCFDIENAAAAWVAFPFHKVYDGNVGRNENWTYDPKIPREYQPNLSRSYTGSYDRGHQMASSDRQATREMNRQTFYYSNMTPQLGTLNQQKWATFEIKVRDQVCADTLFVVTGADYSKTIGSTTDRDGKKCPLPAGYYKVLLRTRLGNTGKAVSECKASELQAIGYYFSHRKYTDMPSPMSVKEIEEKVGFTFFPTVPAEVKANFSTSDWSF